MKTPLRRLGARVALFDPCRERELVQALAQANATAFATSEMFEEESASPLSSRKNRRPDRAVSDDGTVSPELLTRLHCSRFFMVASRGDSTWSHVGER
jgi:hypothetical protein